MSLPDEEEKGDKIEPIEIAAKDIISKLKLVETFSKAYERLITLCSADKLDFFNALDTCHIFATLRKYLELIPSAAPKPYAPFVSKIVLERALKT
jgi:hypothetical protein